MLDTEPRHFTDSDLELLRELAQYAQEHLWSALPA